MAQHFKYVHILSTILCPVDPLGGALLHVFRFLSTQDRCRVGQVCRLWREVSLHPAAWRELSLTDSLAGSQVFHSSKFASLLFLVLISCDCCAREREEERKWETEGEGKRRRMDKWSAYACTSSLLAYRHSTVFGVFIVNLVVQVKKLC